MKKVFSFVITLIALISCFVYIQVSTKKNYLIETDNIATIIYLWESFKFKWQY